MNKCIIIFVIFSVLGWIWESVYCTICDHKWANRGFLYGPVCPIYGCGCIIGFLSFNAIKIGFLPDLTFWEIFIAGFAVSMIFEYPTSWLLERLFYARWWDYSKIPLNINGRTSVPTSIAFGAATILIMKWIMPLTVSILHVVPDWATNLAAIVFTAVLTADFTLTVSALTDFQKLVTEVEGAFQDHMTYAVHRVMNAQNHVFRKAINRVIVFKLPTRKNEIARRIREEKFSELIKQYIETPEVQKMDEFIQHGNTTTLEHCKNVAWISFLINERLHLNAEEKELVEAAMLHDFYLYDWHDGNPARKTHGFDHPYIASDNAAEKFGISDNTKSAIESHMWPLNITKIPKSKEALIICLVDKYCALVETLK